MLVLIPLILVGAFSEETPAQGPLIVRQGTPGLDPTLTYVHITATGPRKGALPLLHQDNVQIFENNVEQNIRYFAFENGPITVAILGSPGDGGRDAPLAFLEALILPQGQKPAGNDRELRVAALADLQKRFARVEYMWMEGAPPIVRVPFTVDLRQLPDAFPQSGASASDFVFVGLEVLKESAYRRKVVLLFAKGVTSNPAAEDDGPATDTYTQFAIRQDVPVYYVAQGSPASQGFLNLQHLAELTGGDGILTTNDLAAEDVVLDLAQELNNQYLIGYRPTNSAQDGGWRKLKVKLSPPESSPKMRARIKTGYYAPKEFVTTK